MKVRSVNDPHPPGKDVVAVNANRLLELMLPPRKGWIPRCIRRWNHRRSCMHGHPSGSSYVSGQPFDLGRGKMFSCSECGKIWII